MEGWEGRMDPQTDKPIELTDERVAAEHAIEEAGPADNWPLTCGVGLDRANARYGAELITCGALVEGLRAWAKVRDFGSEELKIVTAMLGPHRLANAVAEYRYGEFGHHEDLGLAMMAAGVALANRAVTVAQFYETATVFLTRVVGCKYHLDGPVRGEDITAGDRVIFTPEPANLLGPRAIKVTTTDGQVLGCIRRTIARKLAARIDAGATLQGKVALVMEDRREAGDRIYLEVKGGGGGIGRGRGPRSVCSGPVFSC